MHISTLLASRSASQLVFETAKAPFTKLSAGLIVGGGVFAGIGIVVGAITHQQYKHGEAGRRGTDDLPVGQAFLGMLPLLCCSGCPPLAAAPCKCEWMRHGSHESSLWLGRGRFGYLLLERSVFLFIISCGMKHDPSFWRSHAWLSCHLPMTTWQHLLPHSSEKQAVGPVGCIRKIEHPKKLVETKVFQYFGNEWCWHV